MTTGAAGMAAEAADTLEAVVNGERLDNELYASAIVGRFCGSQVTTMRTKTTKTYVQQQQQQPKQEDCFQKQSQKVDRHTREKLKSFCRYFVP